MKLMDKEIGFPGLTAEYKAQKNKKIQELDQGSFRPVLSDDSLFPRLTDEIRRKQKKPDESLLSRRY